MICKKVFKIEGKKVTCKISYHFIIHESNQFHIRRPNEAMAVIEEIKDDVPMSKEQMEKLFEVINPSSWLHEILICFRTKTK